VPLGTASQRTQAGHRHTHPNDRWSLDFASDQFIDGRRLRILVVIDDCTRECLALIPDTSISGIRVTRKLNKLLRERGKPKNRDGTGDALVHPTRYAGLDASPFNDLSAR
jgi:transposase InsO family protein